MAAIYVKVNGRYVAIPTLKGDTSDVSNDIISDAQSIVLPPSVKAIKDYVDDELDDALISAINSGDLVIAFNKYSDLPETGHYAYVRTNETTSQTGSVELVEGNQYTLYLNPAPNFDVEIYGFSITGATGFDDNKYHVFNGAGIVLSIVGIKGTETHIWRYGALGETLYDGWWYLVREFNETISAVQIDYSELPVLSGTVSHDGSALNLGFLLASETPYNTNEFGLYRYDENLEQWVWTDSGYFENQGVLGLFATTNGELTYDGEPIGNKISNAELLEKFSEVNDQLYYDGLPISGDSTITVNKYSDISETNAPLICVKYDETIPQEQFDFEADTEYSLFVNPQIPLNLAFDAVFHPTETSEYVANAIALQLNLTDYSAPVFSIVGVINNNGTITYKMWFYTVNGAIKAAAGELPDLTILSGWSYIEVTDNTIVTNEAINYFTLPALEGIFAEANELGGTYFSETPYSVNNSGLYNYDTDLEKWVRVDGDNSLWCEATGFLSKAFGYGNSTPGALSFAGGYGNSTPGQLSFAGGGSGNSTPGQLSFAGGGSGNNVGGQLGAIGGGYVNNVGGQFGAIGGGFGNNVDGEGGAIGGGSGNNVGGQLGAIGGGYGNNVGGKLGAIGGGYGNEITQTGLRGFIGAGRNLKVTSPDGALFGHDGETTTYTIFGVANGEQKLALNVEDDIVEFAVPVISPQRIEYYGQEVERINADLVTVFTVVGAIEFVLPPAPSLGTAGKFELWIQVSALPCSVTFNHFVCWENSTPHIFGVGVNKIVGFYNPFAGVWSLEGKIFENRPL